MKFIMSHAFHRASVAQWYSLEVLRILPCPTLATRQKKTSFSISLPSSNLTIFLILITRIPMLQTTYLF